MSNGYPAYPDTDSIEYANECACNEARQKRGLRTFKFDGDETDCEECPLSKGSCPISHDYLKIELLPVPTNEYIITTTCQIKVKANSFKEAQQLIIKNKFDINDIVITCECCDYDESK
jgi:hypothetical protein